MRMKCPFFERRVSSYRFSGIKCSANFSNGTTIGMIEEWSKEKREKKIQEHCNGCYQECTSYKSNEQRGGRIL
jgi:hypothetical protein